MDDICRLCCSAKFVNNNIFDEENALYLKMSLYLPIKVFKNDRLPQKICDKCSCKVNDFYQFCNETIEVQNRLRTVLLSSNISVDESVDLTIIKNNASPPPVTTPCEQSTQTDDIQYWTNESRPIKNDTIMVKQEPRSSSPTDIKQEDVFFGSDSFDGAGSDNSDDISLITLKKRKSKKEVNGVDKKTRKKKPKLKDWDILMNALPAGAALTLVNKSDVKKEIPEDDLPVLDVPLKVGKVKSEPNEAETFHCCVCLTQCYSRSEMLQHYRAHAEDSPAPSVPPPPPPPPADHHPLRCTRCSKDVGVEEWSAHWARHWARDRRPYRCALCEKAFRDHHQILKHGLTHKYEEGAESTQPKRFICDLCPEGFVYMRYLLSHRTRAHPEAASRALALRCGTCARQFAHLNSLRRHLRAHSGERNYLCNVCGKALSSREHLKFHIRIHTGYKPNVCKTCGKGFVKKCNLTLHERVHSGEKPHVCSHCGKAFSQRSTLVIHERYHSGARPYVCGLCGRGFVAKGLLSMHLKTTCI